MRYIVDRIEDGNIAVLEREDMEFVDMPLAALPAGVKSGDCLVEESGAWAIDEAETKARRQRISEKMRNLFV